MPLTIDINTRGLKRAARKVDAVRRIETWRRAMTGALYDIVEISRNEYLTGPRPKRLGVGEFRLRNSLRPDHPETRTRVLSANQGEVVGRVGTGVPYGKIHEYGTVGAGGTLKDIVPRNAKALVFQVRGKTVFAKRVAIPPRPFLRPAIRRARGKMRDRFAYELERAFEEQG